MSSPDRIKGSWIGIHLISLLLVLAAGAASYAADDPPRPPALTTVPVPEPGNLAEFVRDKAQAIALGKALFWDMQVGSDSLTACATCHFAAGADPRSTNQVSPGRNRVLADGTPAPDKLFDLGPNRRLLASDFPFRQLADPNDRGSAALFDTNDVVASQGVFWTRFQGLVPGTAIERVKVLPDPDAFQLNSLNVRRSSPRHAPSVINAVFNHRNFSDGRAQDIFNGVNNWGSRDASAHVYRAGLNRTLEPVTISIDNASLASQAVAPPLSNTEMSAFGRTFPELGRKLLRLRPLALQLVHVDDSVLGRRSRAPRTGLKVASYESMVRDAFLPKWWNGRQGVRMQEPGSEVVTERESDTGDARVYSLMERNFSLFFGLAVQLYEATLIADDTPYDRFMRGDSSAVSAAAVRGVDIFRSQARGRCINCHEGAELTGASVTRVKASPVRIREEQAFDRGFNNIGVRPSEEDLGLGGKDPFGNPLSYARQAAAPPLCANGAPCPVIADGFMKVPGLRNVALTAPYFHNGGTLTLRGVVDFYSRGGDFAALAQLDGSFVAPLNILFNSEQEKADLEAFLLALTDERVRLQRAPFDHPQLLVPDGHPVNSGRSSATTRPGNAADQLISIPAVGLDGGVPIMTALLEIVWVNFSGFWGLVLLT